MDTASSVLQYINFNKYYKEVTSSRAQHDNANDLPYLKYK